MHTLVELPLKMVHTKHKVVNELSKSSHYWPLLGCQGCHSDGAFFNNPGSKTRMSSLTTLTTFWMTTIKLFWWQQFWQLVDNLLFCVLTESHELGLHQNSSMPIKGNGQQDKLQSFHIILMSQTSFHMKLKADKPHLQNYPHTLPDYRHTDTCLRMVMARTNDSFRDTGSCNHKTHDHFIGSTRISLASNLPLHWLTYQTVVH